MRKQYLPDRIELCATLARDKLVAIINKVESIEHRRILEYYLIKGERMDDISQKLYLSRSGAYRILREAMEKFMEVYECGHE